MGVKNSNRYNKSKKQARDNRMYLLEEIREYAMSVDFPIWTIQTSGHNNYLVRVYYMGTINSNGMMIPITASINKINELREYIEKWAKDNDRF